MADTRKVVLACDSMATRFELDMFGDEVWRMHAAGEEALAEIRRIEKQLNVYDESSDACELNREAGSRSVRVDARLFRLLEECARLTELSGGAFDITVGPLMRVWGFMTGTGRLPDPNDVEAARELVGMSHVLLNEDDFSVRFDRDGMRIDFGAIGKGYAIDRAVEILLDAGVESALLHGGTSTVYGIGSPPGGDAWRIAIQRPFATTDGDHIGEVTLYDRALSVSAPHGKWFEAGGKRYGHVIDPRSGQPTGNALLAVVVLPSATESDALSTALLTRGTDWIDELTNARPGCNAFVAYENQTGDMEFAGKLS